VNDAFPTSRYLCRFAVALGDDVSAPTCTENIDSINSTSLLPQVFHLQEADIGCVYVSSGMDWTEQRSSFDRVRTCGSQDTIVLFVTPEKVTSIRRSWLDVSAVLCWHLRVSFMLACTSARVEHAQACA
jgi:hypothetical protein